MEPDEEFTERVLGFSTALHHLDVRFSLHAALYRLPLERGDFVEQAANMAAAWKSGAPAHVVLRGMEILSVRPA